ncbi:MAG: alpha/beta fold hydrolase [Paracoccaceae bacterium]|nr:alpha/beta fold hydrolase [Paracoccaceae bacterium]
MASPEARYPPTGEILSVNGSRAHAHIEGRGPAVILIHGASGNLRDFTFDLAPHLAGRYRVIAFDRPGLGHSERLHARGENPFEQAALLDAAAARLGVRRAILVGHSFGAAVALAWAIEHPERVAGVVSLAGVANVWKGGLGPWYAISSSWLGGATVVPLVSAFAPRARAEMALAPIFAPQPVPGGYTAHIGIDLTLRASTLRANARQVNRLKPHVARMVPRYGALDIPVEIVHGDRDTIVPLDIHSRPLAGQVPGARLTVLEGVGHMPHHASPEAVIAAIDRAAARAGLR